MDGRCDLRKKRSGIVCSEMPQGFEGNEKRFAGEDNRCVSILWIRSMITNQIFLPRLRCICTLSLKHVPVGSRQEHIPHIGKWILESVDRGKLNASKKVDDSTMRSVMDGYLCYPHVRKGLYPLCARNKNAERCWRKLHCPLGPQLRPPRYQ